MANLIPSLPNLHLALKKSLKNLKSELWSSGLLGFRKCISTAVASTKRPLLERKYVANLVNLII